MTVEVKGGPIHRRTALQLLASAGLAGLVAIPASTAADDPDMVDIAAMKPGQYVWYPERAPDGFVAIVVSLPEQRCYVYRNGVRIGVSTVSTGKAGHETPVGVFTILQKDVNHHSSVYDNAPMPYTERLTWSGVALHAGGLPGYPSSHGCVHLPLAFAKLLFAATHYGTPVIIADAHSAPLDVLHPGLLLPADVDTTLKSADAKAAPPAGGPPASQTTTATDAGVQPVAMVVSGADKQLTVLRAGDVIYQAPVTLTDPGQPLGNVVYVLKTATGGVTWTSIAHEGNGGDAGKPVDAISRIGVSKEANAALSSLLVPGSTLFVTDLPAHPGTRSEDKDFVILTQATS